MPAATFEHSSILTTNIIFIFRKVNRHQIQRQKWFSTDSTKYLTLMRNNAKIRFLFNLDNSKVPRTHCSTLLTLSQGLLFLTHLAHWWWQTIACFAMCFISIFTRGVQISSLLIAEINFLIWQDLFCNLRPCKLGSFLANLISNYL